MKDQMSGVENAGPENGGPHCRGGKWGPLCASLVRIRPLAYEQKQFKRYNKIAHIS